MAEKKTTQSKSSSTKTTKSSSSSSSSKSSSNTVFGWSLNKISFYTIGAVAILYLVSAILALCSVNLKVVSILQGFATAILICIAAYLAWKYVRNKATVWKVLYFVLLLVVILGIILPLVLL